VRPFRGVALSVLWGATTFGCVEEQEFAVEERDDPEDDNADASPSDPALDDAGSCDRSPTPSRPLATLEAPLFVHPEPSGPHAVGTHIEWLWDDARAEPSTPEDDVRGVGVQFYYPTSVDEGEYGPLLDERISEQLTIVRRYPSGFHRFVETRSRFDVPLLEPPSDAGWPVLVYSHGQTTFPQENTLVFEEFASRGWVVVAVTHTYSSVAAVRPDGTLATTMNVPRLPVDPTVDDHFEEMRGLYELLTETWAKDISFVLDELERFSADDACGWLSAALDFTRVGVWGYSFGGAASHQVCVTDARCRAGADLDGRFHGDPTLPLERPFLMFRTDEYSSNHDWDVARTGALRPTYTVWIRETTHGSFAMNGIVMEALLGVPAEDLGYGATPAKRAHDIYLDYLLAFMTEHVLGDAQPLLKGPSPYDEVTFEATVPGEEPTSVSVLGNVTNGLAGERTSDYEVQVEPGGPAVSRPSRLFSVSPVSPGQELTLTIEQDERVPTVVHVRPESFFEHLGSVPVLTQAELEQLAESAAVDLLPGRGHLWLRAISYYREKAVIEAGGVRFNVAGATTHYLSPEQTVDLAADATLPFAGAAWVFNVEPGRVVVSAEGDGETCVEEYRVEGSAEVEVRAVGDSVSVVDFRCQ
jgi:dienelactone hydrolase